MKDRPAPTLRDVYRARARLAGLARHTPLVGSTALAERVGAPVLLKLETLQETGAFKLRGAANALLALSPEARSRGVVTMSTGNHGRAVAYAARRLGVRAVICLSRLVPAAKVEAVRALGAEVRIAGAGQDEAAVEAARLVAEEGLAFISPFDDPSVIAGQGTIGLELLEAEPDLAEVLVPLSGGGLIAGIALAMKAAAPAIRVIGISMDRGAAMVESLRAGAPVTVEEVASLADSLGGGIGLENRYTFSICRTLVDEAIVLSEAEIAAGMRHLFWTERLVAEGAAAVGVGALLAGKVRPRGPAAIILSGANVDMAAFAAVVGFGGGEQ